MIFTFHGSVLYDDVCNVLKKMKVGKSPAVDNLLNEYICKFRGIFIPLLSCLFNILFHQGNFPTCWSERIISLSFKEKKC